MLKNLFLWIIQNIFKIKTETTDNEIDENQEYAKEYEDTKKINFNALFSNKLGKYTANDSSIEILGENVRAQYLNQIAQSMWKKMAKISSMAYGLGGILLIPYVKSGKIFYNIIPQTRLTIDEITGDFITGATVLSEKKIITTPVSKTTYLRWTNYQIKNNNLIMQQQFTNENGAVIQVPEFWKDIQLVTSISNVDRVPFGYIKSPINNRKSNDKYGVPITYGCEATIQEIRECLEDIRKEYKKKDAFVAMDVTAFGKDDKLPNTGMFKKLNVGEDNFWQIYDPAIRDSSYYNRLEKLYEQLEKEIGTSRGILTDPLSTYQNTDETKRALYDTLSIINDIRENIESGLEDFFYACNIYANAFNITPFGEYQIKYDWDFGLIQSITEEWQQLTTGHDKGVVKDVELRQFIYPSEDIETAQLAIDEIKQSNPSIRDLLGTNDYGNSADNNNGNNDDSANADDEKQNNN